MKQFAISFVLYLLNIFLSISWILKLFASKLAQWYCFCSARFISLEQKSGAEILSGGKTSGEWIRRNRRDGTESIGRQRSQLKAEIVWQTNKSWMSIKAWFKTNSKNARAAGRAGAAFCFLIVSYCGVWLPLLSQFVIKWNAENAAAAALQNLVGRRHYWVITLLPGYIFFADRFRLVFSLRCAAASRFISPLSFSPSSSARRPGCENERVERTFYDPRDDRLRSK